MRFEAIACVRPSLGRAPVCAPSRDVCSSLPKIGNSTAPIWHATTSDADEFLYAFLVTKRWFHFLRVFYCRSVDTRRHELRRLPPPTALAPHSPPRASHRRKGLTARVLFPALARTLSRHRRLIHPKRTTPCLVPPPPPRSWPSRSASPPPAFRRSPTSCTARGPPTPASSSGRSWT